uniref:Aminopeptidase O-like n=1 Tax=Saccoglossus kowalevskii TaxID=10224 RepID=A0ABM0MQJ8_SACKO|nr:PREDICTED: aminopeptidase O-like [Saccoglossus kowalevskii]
MGAHPFERLDLVIMPTCFASLGFASPSVSFLSESLLCGDGSMCCRLAHEITHSWFGFSIGAADWNEEWQSEGFATYMEDHIQALARQWSVDEKSQQLDLHARLRYNILKSDLANTDDNLQTLKPSKHIDDDEHIDCIQDGLNPEKWLTQIHHIKGYFLLRYLSKLVGEEIFFQVLQTYIKNFHGNLVPSKKFFDTLFNICPFLHDEGFTIDAIYKDWLDFPGMPFILQNQLPWKQDNPLINEVYTEVEKWKCRDKALRRKRKRKRAKVGHLKTTQLSPAQLVLFLDTLLELNVISTHTLKELDAIYGFCHQNAEIQHRWCELIVKFQFLQKYDDIKSFLINHQSMGVYLYGELTLSGNTHQRQLAEECFSRVKDDMDQVCYKAVWNMIYG